MSEAELELDGLSIKISHASIELHKRKLPVGAVAKFQCPACNRRDLEITTEDIKRAGAYTDSSGKAHSSIFDSAKTTYELSVERKRIEDDNSDFISYLKQLAIWRRKNEGKFDYAGGGGTTNVSIVCPLCHAKHSLTVTITNPIDLNLGEPDLIEVFEKRGISKSEKNLDMLKQLCSSSPHEEPEDFLIRLGQLLADRKKVAGFKDEISASIQKAKFESEDAQRWLLDLQSSLNDVSKILEKRLEDSLKTSLQLIEEFVSSPVPME